MTQKGRFLWWLLMVAVVATSGAAGAQQTDYAKKIAPIIEPAKLGRPDLAKAWLEKAFEIGDAKEMKLAALDDPDLEPLWRGIGSI
jgi:hypothetical protein